MRRTLAQIAAATAAQHYRDGGHVRGPGTGTSDSIKARLSNGEFVFPDDTVRKVGVKSLRDLVRATHEPVAQKRPSGYFADGGLVDSDNVKQRNSFGDAAAAFSTPGTTEIVQRANPTPVAPPSANVAGAPPVGTSSTANRPVGPDAIPSGGLRTPAADGSQDSWRNTDTGRNLSNIASALPGSAGAVLPAIAKTGGAISGGIDAASRLMAAGAGTAAATAGFTPAAAEPVGARGRLLATANAGAGRGFLNPASVDPTAPPPLSRSEAGQSETAMAGGVRKIERPGEAPLYTNLPGGSGDLQSFMARPSGGPSAQNMAAADNLAASQQGDSNTRVQMQMAREDDARRNSPDALRARALNTLSTRQLGSRRAAQVLMDAAGGMEREQTARAGYAAEAQRYGAADRLARDEFGLKQTQAGFENRSQQRIERAQMDLENAATPTAQRSARDRLMALAGKAPQNEWGVQVTPATKNADGSSAQGSMWRYNKQTGETVRVDDAQAINAPPPAKDSLTRGQVYQTRTGAMRWNGSGFEKVG